MDGASPGEGLLELFTPPGEWKRVCEDSLTKSVAGVICRELGYPDFKEISYENSTCALDHLKDNCTRAPTCDPSSYIQYLIFLVEFFKVNMELPLNMYKQYSKVFSSSIFLDSIYDVY